jgi:thioredoxin-like negative regulator of GroEL
MAKPIDVDSDSFSAEALEANCPVLVDFWSPTCPHCLRLNPEFESAAETLGEEAKLVKLSTRDGMELFREHSISGTPTMILFKDGQEVARVVGAKSSDEICEWVREQV